ncbi:MAG: LTA synthase family protein [Georgenia sp.]
MWAAVVLVHAVVGRLWLSTVVSVTAGAVIAFADYQKMSLRGEPLYPTDIEHLKDAGLLLEPIGVEPARVGLAALVLITIAASTAVAHRRSARSARPKLRRRRPTLLARATVGLLALGVLATTMTFNESGNPLRALWDRSGPTWARWDQVENYAENGFVSGVLYNMPGTAMDRPAGYSAAAMRDLTLRYAAIATRTNATREVGALADTNILLVLSESFTDPTTLRGLEVAEDPIPFTRGLMAGTTSGTMLSSDYGGGTANVEFEVLTGLSLSNFREQMHTPYQMLVPNKADFPSLLRSVGRGHATLAIHPYERRFYRRDDVYATFGFERAAFQDDLTGAARVEDNPFISDAGTFDRVLEELRTSEEPMLVNVVTMQNHLPYEGKYDEPLGVDGALTPAERRTVGQYLRGLRYSDEALEQLVSDLRALDERTIVLFYGDHSPAIWPERILSSNDDQSMYETPWFVWANFETTPKDPGAELLGPNHLVNQLLATAGAAVTPYDALLGKIAEEVPAAERGIMLAPDGREITDEDLSPWAEALLADYRLVQYDLTAGEGFAETALFEPPVG